MKFVLFLKSAMGRILCIHVCSLIIYLCFKLFTFGFDVPHGLKEFAF